MRTCSKEEWMPFCKPYTYRSQWFDPVLIKLIVQLHSIVSVSLRLTLQFSAFMLTWLHHSVWHGLIVLIPTIHENQLKWEWKIKEGKKHGLQYITDKRELAHSMTVSYEKRKPAHWFLSGTRCKLIPSVQNREKRHYGCDGMYFTRALGLLSWIPQSGSVGRPKINEIVHDSIRGDNNTMLKLFNWDSGISPWPNLTPGLFYQAYEIMSQLICFNGQRRILEGDETLALILLWAKHNH